MSIPGKVDPATSRLKRKFIVDIIRDAASYDHSEEGLERAVKTLKTASDYMKNGWVKITEELFNPLFGMGDGYMTHEDRDFCWKELKLGWEKINDRQTQLREKNYLTIKDRTSIIWSLISRWEPYDALTEIKKINQEMKGLRMEKWHYEDLRRILNLYWEAAQEQITERKQQSQIKREKFQSDMRDKIGRLTGAIDKISGSIEYLKGRREKLMEMRDNARSSDFRDKVDEWIEDVDRKINEAINSISEIEDKINDIRSKLE